MVEMFQFCFCFVKWIYSCEMEKLIYLQIHYNFDVISLCSMANGHGYHLETHFIIRSTLYKCVSARLTNLIIVH